MTSLLDSAQEQVKKKYVRKNTLKGKMSNFLMTF